jgi:ferredoxin-thioredoxin reductase catalytic subunit
MAEPKQESLDKMWKYVKGFAEKSGTTMHPTPAVTEAVVNGLAMHMDELGKPLAPVTSTRINKQKPISAAGCAPVTKCRSTNTATACYLCGKTACRSRNISPKATKARRSMASSQTRLPRRAEHCAIRPSLRKLGKIPPGSKSERVSGSLLRRNI